MRHRDDAYLFPGAFRPILSLDELCSGPENEDGSPSFDLTDFDPLPDEAIERDQAIRAVNLFVASLSPRDRQIVHLTFWGDQPAANVAAILGTKEKSVRKALSRIYERGRLALAAYRPVGSPAVAKASGDKMLDRLTGQNFAEAA